ncbi:MAG TPA: arginine deiminase-related protein, partial [Rhodanobacteraceae bacterium]|nr:arginine deiminase-related protein [Rhodanobacteraceae bacterium]
MLTRSPTEFLTTFDRLTPDAPATARAAFLVTPCGFHLAAESARDNRYMAMDQVPDPLRALAEHTALAEALRADVPVVSFPGDIDCPDGVFPNNVFGTAPGRLIIGRMRHPVRQHEAGRADIRALIGAGREIVDLS